MSTSKGNILSRSEKAVFAVALLLFLFFLYVLTQDKFPQFSQGTSDETLLGNITETVSDVRSHSEQDFSWKTLKQDDKIHWGDAIVTGPGGQGKIHLLDGSDITIEENSFVVLKKDRDQVKLNFKFGSGKIVPANSSAPVAAITPRPTPPSSVRANPTRAPAQQRLPELSPPAIVNPKPGTQKLIQTLEDGSLSESRDIKVTLEHPRPRSRFEVQLAGKEDFSENPVSQVVESTALTFTSLSDGQYFLRARQVDRDPRLKSRWSPVSRFSLQTQPYTTGFSSPVWKIKNQVYRVPQKAPPRLEWSEVKWAQKYKLEIATDSQFSSPSVHWTTTNHFEFNNTLHGTFFARVAASTKKDTLGPLSETAQLAIVFPRPSLEPIAPRVILGKSPEDPGEPMPFAAKWNDLGHAPQYEVQLSKDGNFKNSSTTVTRSPASLLTVPGPGSYQWRVRPLDDNNQPLSTYSETGSIEYELKVPLATPTIVEPRQNMTLFFQKNTAKSFWVEWRPVRQAQEYTLEMSTDPEFKNKFLSITLAQTRYLVKQPLPEGKIFWHLRAQAPDRVSNWTEVLRVRIHSGKVSGVIQREDQ